MLTKKLIPVLLSVIMLLNLFSACGADPVSSEASTSVEEISAVSSESVQDPAPVVEEPDVPEMEESAVPESILEPEEALITGVENFTIESYPWGTVELPIVDEPKTFSYFFSTQPFMMSYGGSLDYGTLPYWLAMEEATGITIDVQAVNLLEASEKFNLMIASGDYTNMMEGIGDYAGGPDQAMEDEVIYPMDEIIEEYMPNYKAWLEFEPEYKRAATSANGVLYSAGYLKVGNIASTTGGLIRQDWLDAAGLDVPVTYEDMEEALLAFKDAGHPNALWMNTGLTDAGSNFNLSAGYDVSNGLIVKDGVVGYSFVEDDFRDYVEMLNRWWENDLIYQDFITVAGEIDTSLVLNGSAGVWNGSLSSAELMEESALDGLKVSPFANLRKTEDQQLHISIGSTYTQGSVVISTATAEEDLEYVAKWLDYNYTYDGFMLTNFGEEGVSYELDADGQPQLTDLVVNSPDYITPVGIVMYTKYGGAGICYDPREYFNWDDRDWECCNTWGWNNDDDYVLPMAMSISSEESAIISQYYPDIQTHVQENVLKFITGELELDQWDSYVDVAYTLGMQEVLDAYQAAYDRYAG